MYFRFISSWTTSMNSNCTFILIFTLAKGIFDESSFAETTIGAWRIAAEAILAAEVLHIALIYIQTVEHRRALFIEVEKLEFSTQRVDDGALVNDYITI